MDMVAVGGGGSVSPAGARTRSVACLGCGRGIAQARAWQVYCSDACRAEAWRRRRSDSQPEQARLDFDRVTPAPATGEPYESARVWLLGRLQVGPVSTLELRCPPWRASQNPAQRVLELRNRQHDIRTVRVGRRTWYWLHVDGLPVGMIPEAGE